MISLNTLRRSFLLTKGLLCGFMALSQSTNVEFRVDMNNMIELGLFNSETESVDIAGTFNDWGNPTLVLSDSDTDGIYIGTASLTVGQTIEFKTRINAAWNGREEFPNGGANRSYVVQSDGVVTYWYNDEVPPDVLDVRISANAFLIQPGETVQFTDESTGNPVTWSWSFPGGDPASSTSSNPQVTYPVEGNYDVVLTIEDSNGETVTETFVSQIKVTEFKTNWWNDAIFYEIFVRSFKDSNGDGKGDFKGLIEKLDYLNDGDSTTHDDLGITGIWLMPVQQSPGYHGYDVSDYKLIEQDYGTNADFKQFITEAHKRGIRVIIDYVMNHTSEQHPWFLESANASSEKRDWYIWESTNPGFNGPWGQQVWYPKNNSFYYGLFWSGMPDLNYNTPEVKTAMFDIATFWLEEMDVDGFRLDAVKYIFETNTALEDTEETFQFWKDFRAHYKMVDADAFAVGEAWTSTNTVKKYVNDNGLDYCFEFDLAGSIVNAVNNGDVTSLKNQLQDVMVAYPYLQFGTFLTNHDMDRIMNVLNNDENKAKVAASLLLTFPGIPYLYYGEEIGMTGVKPDENIRKPLQWDATANAGFTSGTPWIPVNDDYNAKNIRNQQASHNSLWNSYRNLIAIRSNQITLRQGNFKQITASSTSVIAFLRQHQHENIVVVSNPGSATVSNMTVSMSNSGIVEGSYKLVELQSGTIIDFTVNASGNFSNITIGEIPPRTTFIYKVALVENTTTTVTLNVDMRKVIKDKVFDKSSESVDVVGNFNGFGEHQLSVLTDADHDSIYSVSLSGIGIGQVLEYKYRLNGTIDGREEFASSSYLRQHLTLDAHNIVSDVYQFSLKVVNGSDFNFSKSVSIYPNPGRNSIFVNLPDQFEGVFNCTVTSILGKHMITESFYNGAENNTHRLATESLSEGLYLLNVEFQSMKKSFKFLIEK